MTQRTRGNDNIIPISEGSRMIAENEKSPRQRRAGEPVTVKMEAVTARFFLNESLWRVVSSMCDIDLRDYLLPLGIKPDDWYLSEDRSLVLMADHKEYPRLKDNLKDLLLRLYSNSPEHHPPTLPAEETAEQGPPSSFST